MTGKRFGATKQQQVYEALRDRIVAGTYGPGYRIVIDATATEFGVSALPVREAIRRLEAEGLVVFRPHAGAQVAPVDPSGFEEGLTVLAVLEGFATGLAAEHLTEEDLDALREIIDKMVTAMEEMNSSAFGRHNREFHERIIDRCPNPALVDMLKDVSRRLDTIRQTVFVHIPYRGASSIAEHRGLIELFEQHADPSVIETAAREHKLHTVQSFREWHSRNSVPRADQAAAGNAT